MDINKEISFKLLEETIGIPEIKIISNDFEESPGYEDSTNVYQKIVFQIEEDDPDIYAIGVLFSLSLFSFTYASPRGYSEIDFVPDDEWSLGYFIENLEFRNKSLCFSTDYLLGRLLKTDIIFESEGKVILETRNRGKEAKRWVDRLQGKNYIKGIDD